MDSGIAETRSVAKGDGISLQKQQLLEKYAAGQLSWREAAAGVGSISPPANKRRLSHRIAFFLAALVLALLVPPWARRDD